MSEVFGKSNCDLTNEKYLNCKKDTNLFQGTGCVIIMLNWLVGLKGEPITNRSKNCWVLITINGSWR